MIHEKSNFLLNLQKKNLNSEKVLWVKDIKKINSYPTIYLANEFFDALPIKQFFKKKEGMGRKICGIKESKKSRHL